jgi:hypothetical protein
MYMSFATHIHVTRIAAMRIIFTRIGCTLLTCDMYMCRERHIHDPVLSSYSVYYHYRASPTPSCNKQHHTYGYVTCSKVNVARSSGTISDVTISRYGSQDLKVIRNIPQRKDIYMSKKIYHKLHLLVYLLEYMKMHGPGNIKNDDMNTEKILINF